MGLPLGEKSIKEKENWGNKALTGGCIEWPPRLAACRMYVDTCWFCLPSLIEASRRRHVRVMLPRNPYPELGTGNPRTTVGAVAKGGKLHGGRTDYLGRASAT
jgi:hypothetical protein